MHRKLIFLIIACFSVCSELLSQQNPVVDQSTEWFAIASTSKINRWLNIYTDVHLRYVKGFQPMQNQVRIAPEWVISKKISIMPIGFVYIRNFIYGDQPTAYENNERRLFQQFVYKSATGKWSFNHRLRLEERYIQIHSRDVNNNITDNGFSNEQFRIRYRLMANYVLNKPKVEPGALSFAFYDEIFVSWGKLVTFNSPDQNRIFVGFGYQFTKDIALQSGFLYQALIKANGVQQENNIGWMTQFTYNFDFSKKTE